MTIDDLAGELAEEKEELARNRDDEALKKQGEELKSLTKKKGEAEKRSLRKARPNFKRSSDSNPTVSERSARELQSPTRTGCSSQFQW